MLAITVAIPPANAAPPWTDLGPTTITGGQDEGLVNQQNPVAGAVVAFAAAPTNANIVFAGTANGGVWKTTNINQTVTVDVNQITAPSLAPGPDASGMLVNGNAAVANGTVTYKITFVDSTGVESNGSQAVSFSLGNTATFNLSNIPTGPTFGPPVNSNTVARNIYRLVSVGGESDIHFLKLRCDRR
jgi:hypothetical protein